MARPMRPDDPVRRIFNAGPRQWENECAGVLSEIIYRNVLISRPKPAQLLYSCKRILMCVAEAKFDCYNRESHLKEDVECFADSSSA